MAEVELDRQQIRRSFERAAAGYDNAAELQREVCAHLLERLGWIHFTPKVVLDLGTGTGQGTVSLRKHYPKAQQIALDLSEGMLKRTSKRAGWFRKPGLLCADARRLPLATDSVDLIFSSLTLQWCSEDLTELFSEFARVLRPGGLLMFTTFGMDTLQNLRQAWAQVDEQVHVNRFVDMHDIGDALLAAGFKDPVMDVERHQRSFESVTELMRSIKAMGAHNVASQRARGLMGRQKLQRLQEAFVCNQAGQFEADYEVVFGMGWLPEVSPLGGSVEVMAPL
ncbi:MAG: malonyl-ACP O-methyltransferase BioC [Gammaproteobacteria bacterium]|nr:malonyl-ACP O-methyltransferase BioC [Gammaproteobacteria bacterium]